jgi:hypothetical protein
MIFCFVWVITFWLALPPPIIVTTCQIFYMSNHTRKMSFCWFLGFLKHHSVGLFSLKAWSISWFVSVIRANGFPYCSLLLWRLSNPCHFWLIFLMEMIFLPCRWVSEAWNYWLCQRWDSFYLFYLQDYQTRIPYGNLAEFSCLAEMDLEHSSIHMAGVYLKLLIQFLENKVAIELTRAEFIEAQEVGYVPAVLIYLGSCCILCDP